MKAVPSMLRVPCSACDHAAHALLALGPDPRPGHHGWLCGWCIERFLLLRAFTDEEARATFVTTTEVATAFAAHGYPTPQGIA